MWPRRYRAHTGFPAVAQGFSTRIRFPGARRNAREFKRAPLVGRLRPYSATFSALSFRGPARSAPELGSCSFAFDPDMVARKIPVEFGGAVARHIECPVDEAAIGVEQVGGGARREVASGRRKHNGIGHAGDLN